MDHKKKVINVAKEFQTSTAKILDELKKGGFEASDYLSEVSDEMYAYLKSRFGKEEEGVVLTESSTQQAGGTHSEASNKGGGGDVDLGDIIDILNQELDHIVESEIAQGSAAADTEGVEERTDSTATTTESTETTAASGEQQTTESPVESEVSNGEKIEVETPTVEQQEAEAKAQTQEEEGEKEERREDTEITRAETPKLGGLKIKGKINVERLATSRRAKKTRKTADQKKEEDKKAKPQKVEGRQKRRERKPKNVKRLTEEDIRRIGRGDSERFRRKDKKAEPTVIDQKAIDKRMRELQAEQNRVKAKLAEYKKKKKEKSKQRKLEIQRQYEEIGRILEVPEFITLGDLASLLGVNPINLITQVINELGEWVTITQRLDATQIELIAELCGREVRVKSPEEEWKEDEEEEDNPEDLQPRPPVVTVMGHVDHGKTSLLDYIRKTHVAEKEAGGITQHIGAYIVEYEYEGEKRKITFLDTPGHEAFTAMRARGAKMTDIAVIVIAADDKIMPQTIEAINHAKAAGVPIVFAINKIDKPGADPARIKGELAQMGYLVEEFGGEYQSQDISAKTGEGVAQLLEKILLQADIMELKANPNKPARGTVIEAAKDKGRGYVMNMLVQSGTLRVGDPIVAGIYAGKVRAMFNEHNQKLQEAGPSTPVLVLGMSGAPQSGDKVRVVSSEKEAKRIANKRAQIYREMQKRSKKRIRLEDIEKGIKHGTVKELKVIVRGDVDGTAEALAESLVKLSTDKVEIQIIHKGVGQINESDVQLAAASNALIVGFQVRPSLQARKLAEDLGVQIKTYSVIYEATEEFKKAIAGMLEPTYREKIIGNLEIRKVFKISKVGNVAGCYVVDGIVRRKDFVRVVRNGIVIFPTKENQHGRIASLKRGKDDVKEVRQGMECGLLIENFQDIKEGDEIEVYELEQVEPSVD